MKNKPVLEPDVDRTFFTSRMNEFVDIVGMSSYSVQVLSKLHGGTRVTIPSRLTPDHWLAVLLGVKNASMLSRYYAGEEIEIPMGPFSSQAERHEAIRRLDREGLTYDKIAQRTGCDRRTVIRHVKGTSNRPKNPDQRNLFDYVDHHPRPRKYKQRG